MALLRKALQNYMPRTLGEATYSTAVRAFQLAVEVGLRDAHAQIWTRNGYRETGWEPFHSSVDFSLWFAREPSSRDLLVVRKNYNRVKRVLPVLGKINLYVATDIECFSFLMNPFELNRDPQLKKKMVPQSLVHERVLAATFLLRRLDEDVKNVMTPSEQTERRWSAHFLAVGSVFESDGEFRDWLNLEDESYLRKILRMVLLLLSEPPSEHSMSEKEWNDFLECLELYYQMAGRDLPLETLRPLIQTHAKLWAVFTDRLCFESIRPSQLEGAMTGVWADLALSGICWQLAKMLSQARFHREEIELASRRSHLDSLQDFSERYLSSSCEASSAIASTIGRIRKLL